MTIWRELRRLSGAPEGLLADAFAAADKGDWCEFVRITTQSLTVPRQQESIKTYRVVRPGTNAYTEPNLPRVVGVQPDAAVVITQEKQWELRRREESAAPRQPPPSRLRALEFCQ